MDTILYSLGLLLVCAIVTNVNACSCLPSHSHKSYCDADYAIKARATKRVRQPKGSIGYNVSIERIFKGASLFKNETRVTLVTAESSSMCGIRLQLRQKLLIVGRASGDTLRLSMCDQIQPWSSVTKTQRRGLRRKFKQHCGDCELNTCWGRGCMKPDKSQKTQDSCNWNPREDVGRCIEKHGLCKRRSNGKCRWSKPDALKRCVSQAIDEGRKEP